MEARLTHPALPDPRKPWVDTPAERRRRRLMALALVAGVGSTFFLFGIVLFYSMPA